MLILWVVFTYTVLTKGQIWKHRTAGRELKRLSPGRPESSNISRGASDRLELSNPPFESAPNRDVFGIFEDRHMRHNYD